MFDLMNRAEQIADGGICFDLLELLERHEPEPKKHNGFGIVLEEHLLETGARAVRSNR